MSLRLLFIWLLSLCLTSASAKDNLVRCTGEYVFSFSQDVPRTQAIEESKAAAVQRAIGDKLGTFISAQSFLEMTTSQPTKFYQLSQSVVRGQWVKDKEEPQCEVTFQDNLQFVRVRVDFMARPIEKVPAQFEYHVLCNGTEDRFDNGGNFHGSRYQSNSDRFYMSFKSWTEGYVAVFFEEPGKVTRLLPYQGEDGSAFHVAQGIRNVFFDTPGNRFYTTCVEQEVNLVHVLFSPVNFINKDVPEEMSIKDYRKWLSHVMSYNHELQESFTLITVKPRD